MSISAPGGHGQKIALHRRITLEIEEKIRSGAWPPGHRIPFEHELTEHYACARATVNKAVSALAADGLIHRLPGQGSFVAPPRVHALVVEIPDIEAEITKRGQKYGYRLLSRLRRAARTDRPDEVALAHGGDLLALRCLHFADERRFCLEERLISLFMAPNAAEESFESVSPSAWLVGHIPWSSAEHRIVAVNADADHSHLLGIPAHAACLIVERKTWRGDDQVTEVLNIYPGDVFDLFARFSPPRA